MMPLMLGRQPRSYNPRVPAWSSLRTLRVPPEPAAPVSHNWLAGMPANTGMMLNDTLGDCVAAAIYHGRQVRSFNADGAPGMITEPDSDVLRLYEIACGYKPSDPSSDQGGNEQAVLTYITKHGLPIGSPAKAEKLLLAFLEVDHANHADVMEAIYLCGGVYIGFNVPAFLMDNGSPPGLWDVRHSDTQIIGGHAIWIGGYDSAGVDLISWGAAYRMTWAFWDAYVDEVYATAWQDWIEKTGMTPLGLSVAQLEQQMAGLRE